MVMVVMVMVVLGLLGRWVHMSNRRARRGLDSDAQYLRDMSLLEVIHRYTPPPDSTR
jgi:hypothetical protein